MVNAGGFEPLADGLKGRALSIRVYAQRPNFVAQHIIMAYSVYPLSLQFDWLVAHFTPQAIGSGGRFCPCLQTVIGRFLRY